MKLVIYTADGEVELEGMSDELEALELEANNSGEAEAIYEGAIEEESELESSNRSYQDFPLASARGVPQTKVEWHRVCRGRGITRVCWREPRTFVRHASYKAYARVSIGRVTDQMVWDAVRRCVQTAAVNAGIAGILAGIVTQGAGSIAAAQASFSLSVTECLRARGGEFARIATDLRLSLYTTRESGPWRRV